MQTGVDTLRRERISEGVPSIFGENTLSGNRLYGSLGESRKTDNEVKPNRAHSLSKKEFHNELCVQLKQGSFDVRNNFVSNLYACIKNHPNYKNGLVFTADMNVNKILSLMRNEIERLMPSNAETIIESTDGDVRISSYCSHDMLCNQQAMPLRWLLKMKYENPKLYVILRNVISLIKGKFKIHDPHDGFSDMAKETFFEGLVNCQDKVDFNWNKKGFVEMCSADELESWEKWIDVPKGRSLPKKDGKGYLLISEMNDIYHQIDEDWLMNQINTYKPKNSLFIKLLKWAKSGMELYYNHHDVTIHDLVFITSDEYEQGQPVTALDFLKFEWDFRCPFWEFGIEQWLNDHAGQVGVIETRAWSTLTADRYTNKFEEKYELFGKELECWFDFGTDIYYHGIWDWEKR